MPIAALQPQNYRGVGPHLPELQANEGVASTAQRIGSIVLSIIASLVSFAFLPVQGALLVSAAATALFLAWGFECCRGAGGDARPRVQNAAMPIILQPMPWYRRAINWIPFFRREVVPVADGRPREHVGGAAFDPVLHDERAPGLRVRARDVPAGAIAVMPPALHPGVAGGGVAFVAGREGLGHVHEERDMVGRREAPAVRARDIPAGAVAVLPRAPAPPRAAAALGFGAPPAMRAAPAAPPAAFPPPAPMGGGVEREMVGRR